MNAKTPRDWRELCRKAAEEMDPDKLMDLVVEINEALDEHIKKRKRTIENSADIEGEEESRPSEVASWKRPQPSEVLAYLNSLHLSRSLHLA